MSNDMYIARSTNEEIFEKAESGGLVTSLLTCALDSLAVDGVVTVKPMNGNRYAAVPVLITKTEDLLETAGSLHCSAPNVARFVKEYLEGSTDSKLAVVGKPCDIRAIIELQKRHQINEDNLILIGLNCTGTLPPAKTKIMYREKFEVDPNDVVAEDIDGGNLHVFLKDGTTKSLSLKELEAEDYGRRNNCRRCEFNIPVFADIACGKWGTEDVEKKSTFVEICSDKGKMLFDKALENKYIEVEKATKKQIDLRDKKDKEEQERAAAYREKQFKILDEMSLSEKQEYWFNEFDKCIKCYGCRDACPICYCESCLLEADRHFVEPGEIPPNALFPFTRLAHVADSCVNCGQCEDACPMELPLSKLFNYLNWKLRDIFQYIPGVDREQLPPLIKAKDAEMQIDDTFLDIAEIMEKE